MNPETAIMYGRDLTRKTSQYHRLEYSWFRESNKKPRSVERKYLDKSSLAPEIMRETFSRFFSGDTIPKLDTVAPEHSMAAAFQAALDDIPEASTLAENCNGDRYNAGLVTSALTEQVMPLLPGEATDGEHWKRYLDMLDEDGVNPDSQEYQEALSRLQEASSEATENAGSLDTSALRTALREAISKATGDVRRSEENARSLGWSTATGGTPTQAELEAKAEINERLKKNPRLQEILLMAGRFDAICRRAQRTTIKKSTSEVCNIDIGNEISRLLPSELALFSNPELAPVFQRKYLERALLEYQLESKERQARGPIVVCIDDSSSMHGHKEVWAKALALALMNLARKQKRNFGYCMFNTSVAYSFIEDHKNPSSPMELLDKLSVTSGGGTEFNPPLNWALDLIIKTPNLKKADIIFITDGYGPTSAATIKRMKSAKKNIGVRTIGILIGVGESGLKPFSDEVYDINTIVKKENTDEEKVANRVLSV
jgi:uncharacterized protein with von Willebrand factor type A (vWA) domain